MQAKITNSPPRIFPPDEYISRIEKFQHYLKKNKIDGVLIFDRVNRIYFTGLDTSNGILLIDTKKGPIFFTDARYIEASKNRIPFLVSLQLKLPPDDYEQFIKLTSAWHNVGYEGSLSVANFSRLKNVLSSVIDWQDIGSAIKRLRMIKSPYEQQVMRQSMRHNDKLMKTSLKCLEEGMSEWELAVKIRQYAEQYGHGTSFDCIACFGANGAEPHHHPGSYRLKKNQCVLIDLGLKLDYYCSDLTRTICFGEPSKLLKEVHKIVLSANKLAIRKIAPGMVACDVDRIARNYIDEMGYGEYFTHGLGHSLGLEIHEIPSISPVAGETLQPGMIITIEPGIYMPGSIGVRIEDVVLITKNGAELLSHTPREINFLK